MRRPLGLAPDVTAAAGLRLRGVTDDREAAARLLAKLRRLVDEGLDPDERVLLGVCLAPAVVVATQSEEVDGLAVTPVGDKALIEFMRSEVRRAKLQIADFPDDEPRAATTDAPDESGIGRGISPM